MPGKEHTYLALGDSYTIGESVDPDMNFPSQTTAMMRIAGFPFADPKIIAVTGWTTDELLKAIRSQNIVDRFDFVSLLIGVNNQYRAYPVEVYVREFRELASLAIGFSGNYPKRVFVLSIPDWGYTPFAADRNREQISREIENYNKINREIAAEMKIRYLDITVQTRTALTNPTLVASDGLHPSAKAYTAWSEELAMMMKQELK